MSWFDSTDEFTGSATTFLGDLAGFTQDAATVAKAADQFTSGSAGNPVPQYGPPISSPNEQQPIFPYGPPTAAQHYGGLIVLGVLAVVAFVWLKKG